MPIIIYYAETDLYKTESQSENEDNDDRAMYSFIHLLENSLQHCIT